MLPIETIERPMPRSAIRYRPLSEKQSSGKSLPVSRASRFRQPQPDVETEDRQAAGDVYETDKRFAPKSARSSSKPSRSLRPLPARTKRRVHPLMLLGIGMLFMLLLWVGINWAITWGTDAINTLRFGYPRVYQTDAVVGHHDSASSPSHFLAVNLRGQVEVIEWPGGDVTHARVYMGPQLFGANSDQQPVTLRFADLTGNGQLDMIVEIGSTRVVFLNDQGSFRPVQPSEQNQIQSRLHQIDS